MKNLPAVLVALAFLGLSGTASADYYWEDHFDDNSKNWPFLGSTKTYSMQIRDGHLVIDNDSRGAVQTVQYLEDANLDKKLTIAARMSYLKGDPDSLAGIRFGISGDGKNFYSFTHNQLGQFYLSRYESGKFTPIKRLTKTDAINPLQYNVLAVHKNGNEHILYINAKEVYRTDLDPWQGKGFSLSTSRNSALMVDSVSAFEPATTGEAAAEFIVKPSRFGKSARAPAHDSRAPFVQDAKAANLDFQEFMVNFAPLRLPYIFDYSGGGRDITALPFTQKQYYRYAREGVTWALGQVSYCKDGYVLLMMRRYQTGPQDNSRFYLDKYSRDGKLMNSREIGTTTKENGRFFQGVEFGYFLEGDFIRQEVLLTTSNGQKQQSVRRHHDAVCVM